MSPDRPPFATLDQVLITDELRERPAGKFDSDAVERAVISLNRFMAESPGEVLQKLAEAAMGLCKAHTVGISILESDDDGPAFKSRALAGRLAPAKGLRMPRNASPSGMVFDRGANLLFAFPEAHFRLPAPVHPPIFEVLLAPFHCGGDPVGTVWVIAHDDERKFDRTDVRIVNALCRFASGACARLNSLGYLQGVPEPARLRAH